MKRDISNIERDLESKENNDVIYKKYKLQKMFEEDPDIMELLGKKQKQPLNRFADPDNPTEEELEERKRINDYNERTTHKQILPYFKLNGLQKEVVNFLMFDIYDDRISYVNEIIKRQYIDVMCLVHEDDMDTPYKILRTDLLSYVVRDLLCWTNALGMKLKLAEDTPSIVDEKYYSRRLRFVINAPNTVNNHMGMHNKYDRLTI